MPQPSLDVAYTPPRWLVAVGSVLIAGHLLALVFNALAAPSGPWPSPEEGQYMGTPPQFAFSVSSNLTLPYLNVPYLRAVKLTHNYHFLSNRPTHPGVYVEFRLKDEEGNEVATVKLPDDGANPWVRHRQSLLALALGEDQPVRPLTSELIPDKGMELPKVQIWEEIGPRHLRIRTVDLNRIPRNRPVVGPSEWSQLMARSYARYLCRTHGAARAEVVRHHQDPIPPFVMFEESIPAGSFDEVISEWGELSR
jgi:hypothetical protein